jgi:acetyl-CoA acetyltransferase family protein
MAREIHNPFIDAGREVVIAEAVRTPIGRANVDKGWYRDVHPNAMLAATYTELLDRSGLEPGAIEDLIIGCTAPFGEQSRNIARNAWLQAGYPPEVPGMVLDRRCGSAQTAVEIGASFISSGTHELVIAGGVEHMGHIPINSPGVIEEIYGKAWTPEMWARYDFVTQGEAAELIRERWGISREEQDEFAVRSHELAAAAIAAGRFDDELVRMMVDGEQRHGDQSVRPGTTAEVLAGLKPAFRAENGTVTAGSSSPLSDGAAGVLLASRDAASAHGLTARARILDQTTVGVDPIIMLTGPIPATRKLLERNGLSIHDIDLIEINEAFSSVVLAWERELQPDMDRVNVNGGAIALGHPVGATGSRLFATLLAEMERRDVELGLVTMCCGGGLGTATLIQRLRS